MSEILLSFCIPTYNRPKKLYSLIKEIIKCQEKEFEIIIGDDNPLSNETQILIKKLTDPRIIYFHNKKNLGVEMNLLKMVRKARGKFIFSLADDDFVEVKVLPWILKTISENKNITQLRGAIGDKRPGKYDLFYEFGEGILKRGYESLKRLLFYYGHGSGTIIRRDVLDLNKVQKYCNSYVVFDYLVAQAMLAGDTLCTTKIFAYKGLDDSQRPPLFKNKKWWHPISGLVIIKFRIKVINEISKGKLRRYFLEKEKQNIYSYLYRSLNYETKNMFYSFKSLLEGLSIVIPITELSIFPKFWIDMIIEFTVRLLNSLRFKMLLYIFKNLKKFSIKKYFV